MEGNGKTHYRLTEVQWYGTHELIEPLHLRTQGESLSSNGSVLLSRHTHVRRLEKGSTIEVITQTANYIYVRIRNGMQFACPHDALRGLLVRTPRANKAKKPTKPSTHIREQV